MQKPPWMIRSFPEGDYEKTGPGLFPQKNQASSGQVADFIWTNTLVKEHDDVQSCRFSQEHHLQMVASPHRTVSLQEENMGIPAERQVWGKKFVSDAVEHAKGCLASQSWRNFW